MSLNYFDPDYNYSDLELAILHLNLELRMANQIHGPFTNPHEAYGVIMEEVCEFFDEVRRAKHHYLTQNMEKELLQVAAMCIKAILTIKKEPQNA